MKQLPRNIILFDGVCNFCNGILQLLIKLDQKNQFYYASLQSTFGQELLKKYQLSVKKFDSFVYIKKNKSFEKSNAVLEILRDIGKPLSFLYMLKIIPNSIRDKGYDFIAKYRYIVFGKRKQCVIPTKEIQNKFLV